MKLDADDLRLLAPILRQAVADAIRSELQERRALRRRDGIEPLAVDSQTAAAMLGISVGVFRGLVVAGELTGFEVGGSGDGERRHRRFSIDELRSWVAARTSAAGGEGSFPRSAVGCDRIGPAKVCGWFPS